jgi:hypothetical protein
MYPTTIRLIVKRCSFCSSQPDSPVTERDISAEKLELGKMTEQEGPSAVD